MPRLAKFVRLTTNADIAYQDAHTIEDKSETPSPDRNLVVLGHSNEWKVYMLNRNSKQQTETNGHQSQASSPQSNTRNEATQNRYSRPPCMTTGRRVGSSATLLMVVRTEGAGVLTHKEYFGERDVGRLKILAGGWDDLLLSKSRIIELADAGRGRGDLRLMFESESSDWVYGMRPRSMLGNQSGA